MTQQETTATTGTTDVASSEINAPLKENGSGKSAPAPTELGEDGVETTKAVIEPLAEALTAGEAIAADPIDAAEDHPQPEASKGADASAAETNGGAAVAAEKDAAAVDAGVKHTDAKPANEPKPEPASEDARTGGPGPTTSTEAEPATDGPDVADAEPAASASASQAEGAAKMVPEPEVKGEQQQKGEGKPEAVEGSEPKAAEESSDVKAEGTEVSEPKVVVEQSSEPKGRAAQGIGLPPAAVAVTGGSAETAGMVSPNDASMVTPPGTVQALSRRLSSNSLPGHVTPTRSMSAEKQLASIGGAASAGGAVGPGGRLTKSPSVTPSGEASPLSTHDTKNTINVSQLIKLGAFKMQPLKDFVPYDELLRLRLEDGIDATRKEEYLSDADFKEVFGLDRDAFRKQPAWRQAQAKKKANLF